MYINTEAPNGVRAFYQVSVYVKRVDDDGGTFVDISREYNKYNNIVLELRTLPSLLCNCDAYKGSMGGISAFGTLYNVIPE